ncbi:UNVERIFIED_CONTAM: hypothetical protein Sradi_3136400 [Sesamum radiatum]|uniref:Uncharacterized protein n=1 Tax=Sesamum radiatum TaxID=300843 RepID=A0AAW2RE35_SESRA
MNSSRASSNKVYEGVDSENQSQANPPRHLMNYSKAAKYIRIEEALKPREEVNNKRKNREGERKDPRREDWQMGRGICRLTASQNTLLLKRPERNLSGSRTARDRTMAQKNER